MSPREALVAARALIADPASLTHSHSARNKMGYPVHPHAKTARQWNASGALMRVTQRRRRCPGNLQLLAAADGLRRFVEVETRGTHAAILALFDRAIENAPGSFL